MSIKPGGWKCIVLLSLGLRYFQFRDSSARRLRPISPLAHTPRHRRHSTTGPVSISAPTAATAGEAPACTGVPGGIPTNHDPSGALAGGQIGYNWQTGSWVYGLEADGDWANIRGSALCPNPIASCASDTRALASFRGRLGWATGPVLLYGTGGLGYANTRFSALTVVGGLPALGATGSYTTDRWGFAAGAGIEYGFTPNWSAKLEYMHYGFGTVTAPVGTLDPSPVATRLRVDTVKVGINYRWGGPIASTY